MPSRSTPKPSLPDFPIRGYEYYDYRHDIVDTTFVNYEDNDTRKTGAIGNLLFSSFGVSTNNAFERLKFVKAKPVYFPPMANNSKWASDNGGNQTGESWAELLFYLRDCADITGSEKEWLLGKTLRTLLHWP